MDKRIIGQLLQFLMYKFHNVFYSFLATVEVF